MISETVETLHIVTKLSKDVAKALMRDFPGGITDNHARYLVDEYQNMQKARIRSGNYIAGLDRDAKKSGNAAEPHEAMDALANNYRVGEENIKKLLDWYLTDHPMFWFFERTLGIGPVLAAGLLAYIDIEKCPTVGHIWRFCGYDPTQIWNSKDQAKELFRACPGEDLEERLYAAADQFGRNKGSLLWAASHDPAGKPRKLTEDNIVAALARKPYNGALKTICWKIGDSFVKLSGRQDAFYGQLYKQRKAAEWVKNLNGDFQETARQSMAKKKYGKATDQYAWYTGQCSPDKVRELMAAGQTLSPTACKGDSGFPMLSPGHIDARARRYAVKIFLSHLHECWFRTHFGEEPPKPFAISIQGHAHYLPPPQLGEAMAEAA